MRGVVTVGLALGLYAAPAAAETQTAAPASALEEQGRHVASLRLSTGLGGGSIGIGARLGGAFEYWLLDTVGVGLEGGVLGQTTVTIGSGAEGSALFIAPVVVIRENSARSFFFASLGAGYARLTRTDLGELDVFGPSQPDPVVRRNGYTIGAAAGWLVHPSGSLFEFGPVARVDLGGVLDDSMPLDYLVSVNIELGFAVLGE